MIWTWRTCGSNRTAPQATQPMPQSIYWKPSLENVLSQEMVQSVGRHGRAIWRRYTICCGAKSSLWSMLTSQRRLMNFVRISNVKLQQYRPIYAGKSVKIGFSVWTAASVPVVAMQKESSFSHNGIACTFTGIKTFNDIQNCFCFI